MRIYSNVQKEKDYRALAPPSDIRKVKIGNQHTDDEGQTKVVPQNNDAKVKQSSSPPASVLHSLRPSWLRSPSLEVKERGWKGGHADAVGEQRKADRPLPAWPLPRHFFLLFPLSLQMHFLPCGTCSCISAAEASESLRRSWAH